MTVADTRASPAGSTGSIRSAWLLPEGKVTVACSVTVCPTASGPPGVAASVLVCASATAGAIVTTAVAAVTAPLARLAPPELPANATTCAVFASVARGAGMPLVACKVNATSATLLPDVAL